MIEGLTTIHSQQSKQQGQTSRKCFISLFVFLSLLYYGFVCNKIYKLEFFHFSLLELMKMMIMNSGTILGGFALFLSQLWHGLH